MDGHSYIMDTATAETQPRANPGYTASVSSALLRSGNDNGAMSEEEEEEEEEQSRGDLRSAGGSATSLAQPSPAAVTPQTQSSAQIDGSNTTNGETQGSGICSSGRPQKVKVNSSSSHEGVGLITLHGVY